MAASLGRLIRLVAIVVLASPTVGFGGRASVARGGTGIPARASVPFDRADERSVSGLLARPHHPAVLRAANRGEAA